MTFPESGLVILTGSTLAGLGFTFGAMLICKAFKWAPVNTSVQIVSPAGVALQVGSDVKAEATEGKPMKGGK